MERILPLVPEWHLLRNMEQDILICIKMQILHYIRQNRMAEMGIMSIRKRQEKNRNNVRKGYRRNERKMDENTVLPLINSTFEPGHALEKVESFKDKKMAHIPSA